MNKAAAVAIMSDLPRARRRPLTVARSLTSLGSLVRGAGLVFGVPLLIAVAIRAMDRGFTVAQALPVSCSIGLIGTLVLFRVHSRRPRTLPAPEMPDRDAGMTLIELVMVLMIMPLIIGAVSYAFVEVLFQQNTVATSLADTADAQVVSSTYINDVESASALTTDGGSNPPASPDQCGSVGTQLLGLEWNGFTPVGASTQAYETVVSYDLVQHGTAYSLTRYYCTTGYSLTPTSTTEVAGDVASTLQPPIISPSSVTGASSGWVAIQGVTGVTFPLTELGSRYQYSLTADPASGQQDGVIGSIAAALPTNCGFATPTTGTYAGNLCFADFSNINFAAANSTSGKGCQPEAEGISGTPFTISFCLQWTSVVGGSSSLKAVPLPTYASPPTSEAFLGTNGFYEGVPGDPALYQQVEGSRTEIFISKISVTDSSGQPATGWELVTGDAESTDSGESTMWSTCPSISSPSSTNPFYVVTGAGCTSNDPALNLLDNTPTSPFGNACADYGVTSPPSYAAGIYLTGIGSPSVECGATVNSDKTGTVMLEASSPSTLSMYLSGTGLEGVFLGVLLP